MKNQKLKVKDQSLSPIRKVIILPPNHQITGVWGKTPRSMKRIKN